MTVCLVRSLYQAGENRKGGKSCGKLQVLLQFCEQPVQEPVPVAPVNPQDHSSAVMSCARAEPKGQPSADTTGQLIHQESANQFHCELGEEIEHGLGTMALTGQFEKAGKAGPCPNSRYSLP